MSKPAPLQPNTIYHIYNRGNNRETIFRAKENFHYFLTLYTDHFHPWATTYAYCLLPNHFHFLAHIRPTPITQTPRVSETLGVSPATPGVSPTTTGASSTPPRVSPAPNPSQAFSNLCNAYAKAYNKVNGRTGSLLEHPFGRIPVTTDAYFYNLITYIHRNPQKHNLIADFRDWPYSSYHAILHDKPTRIDKTAVLDWYGGPAQFQEAHQTDPNETLLQKWLGDQD